MKLITYQGEERIRVDVFLVDELGDFSRAKIQQEIKDGKVLVNQMITKANHRLEDGDIVSYNIVEEVVELNPIKMDIEILYQDQYLAIINKPYGLVVYPGAGKEEKSLVAALLGMGMPLAASEDELRPGIVHRLDKDTSGLMVVAKDQQTSIKLAAMMKEHIVERKYYALVDGIVEHNYGTIDAPIGRSERNRVKMEVISGGREAITYFKVLKRLAETTLLECRLQTGRTHQIRVHMRYIEHPILGDDLYGRKSKDGLMKLQSYYISFTHPITEELIEVTIPMRKDFEEVMSDE